MKITRKELEEKAESAFGLLKSCKICPRRCGVNRLEGEIGYCGIGKDVIVSSFGSHYGEESVLTGTGGSGTIFFAGCNLKCLYCQNYEISHMKLGKETGREELSEIMLRLEKMGCHNINLVTPSHVVPQILKALGSAFDKGLNLPIVYNSGGYDEIKTLQFLDGVVDIYMPDIKYAESKTASKYSDAPDYPQVAKKALKEMYSQVGDLKVDEREIAFRGLLIRHLVLPNNLAGSAKTLKFIANKISKDSYVNIMDQFRPCYKAHYFKELARRVTSDEYKKIIKEAEKLGLKRGFT
jgi:putative pyruvate formate lyase activating enzyme